MGDHANSGAGYPELNEHPFCNGLLCQYWEVLLVWQGG